MAFVFAQKYLGVGLYLVVVLLLMWIPLWVYRAIRQRELRSFFFARMAIWVAAVALVAGIHYIRHITTRHQADEIAAAVTRYSQAHGHCPASLTELGMTREQLREKLGTAGYDCRDGKPFLAYAAPFVGFAAYHYDFANGAWKYYPD
jgi:hypothetical protein